MTIRNTVVVLALILGIVGGLFLFVRGNSVTQEEAQRACDAFAQGYRSSCS